MFTTFRPAFSVSEQQQRYFDQRTRVIVSTSCERIHQAVQDNLNLQNVFYQELDRLATERRQIAIYNRTEGAEEFGKRRDINFGGPVDITPLMGSFLPYNQRVLDLVLSILHDSPSQVKKKKINYPEPCLGRVYSLDFSVFRAEEIDNWYWTETPVKQQEIRRLMSEESISIDSSKCLTAQILGYKAVMKKLKANQPQDFKKIKFSIAMSSVISETEFCIADFDWIILTKRCQVNGKKYALTQYVVPIIHIPKLPLLQRAQMGAHACLGRTVQLLHQDPFLIPDMLAELAQLFEQIIRWDGAELEALKNQVALFEYLLAHAMPFSRGTASISEWLEMIMYQYHGFKLEYTQQAKVNIEAITLSLKQFVDLYPDLIRLTPSFSETEELSDEEKSAYLSFSC